MIETRPTRNVAPVATTSGGRLTRPLTYHERRRLNDLVDLGVVIREKDDGGITYRRNPDVESVRLVPIES